MTTPDQRSAASETSKGIVRCLLVQWMLCNGYSRPTFRCIRDQQRHREVFTALLSSIFLDLMYPLCDLVPFLLFTVSSRLRATPFNFVGLFA